MKKHGFLAKAAQTAAGKHGMILLTLLNTGLACLVVTLAGNWHCLDLPSLSNQDFMTFYLIDYRVGFVSRALIGSIIYLFTDHPTVRMITAMLITAVMLSLLVFAFLQAQIAKKALQTADHASLLFSYLLYLNCIFWCDSFEYIGLTDIFITLLAQFYLICVEKKRQLGYALAPLVIFVGLLINTTFVFVAFPVMAAILWFDLLRQGKPERIRVVLFVLSCVLTVALFILFVFCTQSFVRVSWEELKAMMAEKYDGPLMVRYYGYYLYRQDEVRQYTAESTKDFLPFLFRSIDLSSSVIRRNFLNYLPLTAVFFAGCFYHARQSRNRKIAYLGFFAPFVMLFPALNFSDDKDRFFSLILMAQYMLLHYLMTQTHAPFLPCAAVPPLNKLSRYEEVRRKERLTRGLRIGAVVGLAFTLAGTRFL